jgi:hypothetical protein
MKSRILTALAVIAVAGCAQLGSPANTPDSATTDAAAGHPMLKPLAHWVGGRWVGAFESGGRRFTLVRTYNWSFDGRTLIGRSFGERDGKLVQSRETIYFFNPDTKRIEFSDYIDSGGVGLGWLEVRDGQIYMDVKVVGNAGHPPWRAWIKDDADSQVIKVEALRDGKWIDFGTYPYRRER